MYLSPMLDNLLKKCQSSSLWKLQNLPPNYLRNAGKMGGKRFDYQFLVQRSVPGGGCFQRLNFQSFTYEALYFNEKSIDFQLIHEVWKDFFLSLNLGPTASF